MRARIKKIQNTVPQKFASSSAWYQKKLPSKKIPPPKKTEEIKKTDAKITTQKQKMKRQGKNDSTSAELTDMGMGKMPADKVKTFLGKKCQ